MHARCMHSSLDSSGSPPCRPLTLVLRWLLPPLQGDDSLFKSKFCVAYQTMSTIGYQFPADYETVAPTFVLS